LNAAHLATMSRTATPPSALTPAVHLRSAAGARRAIPRRIHGVRLAITSTARSERRIAVRGPGVGIDASSASADPARAPWRSAWVSSLASARIGRRRPSWPDNPRGQHRGVVSALPTWIVRSRRRLGAARADCHVHHPLLFEHRLDVGPVFRSRVDDSHGGHCHSSSTCPLRYARASEATAAERRGRHAFRQWVMRNNVPFRPRPGIAQLQRQSAAGQQPPLRSFCGPRGRPERSLPRGPVRAAAAAHPVPNLPAAAAPECDHTDDTLESTSCILKD
jgi:hypothetical protein